MTFSISATGTIEHVRAVLRGLEFSDELGNGVVDMLLGDVLPPRDVATGGAHVEYTVQASGHHCATAGDLGYLQLTARVSWVTDTALEAPVASAG